MKAIRYDDGPETLHLAEAAGIDTMCVINAQADLYRKYRDVLGFTSNLQHGRCSEAA